MNTTLAFFTQTEKRLGLTAAEDGTPSGSLEHLGRHRPVQRDPEAPRLRLLPQRALHHPQDRHDLPRPPN
ncbi:MAG: hypothetical protein ACLUW6_11305 [Coriobacteriaceae bacterium]